MLRDRKDMAGYTHNVTTATIKILRNKSFIFLYVPQIQKSNSSQRDRTDESHFRVPTHLSNRQAFQRNLQSHLISAKKKSQTLHRL